MENNKKYKAMKKLEEEKQIQIERLFNENKNLRKKIKLVIKLTQDNIEMIRKEGKQIRQYLKSRYAIIKNDEAIIYSSFARQMTHYQSYIEK